MKNVRYNGEQFKIRGNKTGRDGLFNNDKGVFVDCPYLDVTASLKQRKEDIEKGTININEGTNWIPSGTVKKMYFIQIILNYIDYKKMLIYY